jgi:hypothetical protein
MDEGFLSAESIRRFVAENYSAHPHAFEIAQLTELSRLKSALYGFNVEPEEAYRSIPMRAYGMQLNVNSTHALQLSKSLYDDAETVWLTHDEADDGAYETRYEPLHKQRTYDVVAHLVNQSGELKKIADNMNINRLSERDQVLFMRSIDQKALAEEMLKKVSLIVVSEQIVLKFSVTFEIGFDGANTHVAIETCKSTPLTDEDYKAIGKDQNA